MGGNPILTNGVSTAASDVDKRHGRTRLDARFAATVSRKAREGRILYTEAYELIGAKGKTYDNLIKYVEGRV